MLQFDQNTYNDNGFIEEIQKQNYFSDTGLRENILFLVAIQKLDFLKIGPRKSFKTFGKMKLKHKSSKIH